MRKRKIRLDEDSLHSIVGAALKDAGFLAESSVVRALEFKTRTLKKGGDYYKDLAEPGYTGEVEVVKWVRVLAEEPTQWEEEENSD